MMKLAPSELRLLAFTLAVLLLALTYLALKPSFAEWAAFGEQRLDLEERLEKAEALLDRKPAMEARLDAFRQGLPVFSPGQNAGSDLLPALEKMAPRHGLTLTRRETPEPERQIGDLYETALACSWEGTLEALVRFLHAQQALGPVSDVRLLEIKPLRTSRNEPTDRLAGKFTIDYAYRREAPASPDTPDGAAP